MLERESSKPNAVKAPNASRTLLRPVKSAIGDRSNC
jgi:hypothetical protein